jgi:hypothetical protein
MIIAPRGQAPPLASAVSVTDDEKPRNMATQTSHNLPGQVSTFIGRDTELAEVRRLVDGSRLVTLTGAGGAGKTRLGRGARPARTA